KYVEISLSKNLGNAFVLNVDNYHNIHVLWQSDSTSTSRLAHMATIIANPCPISAILYNRALNPKIIDDKLIIKHLDEWFIINYGIPYNERKLGHTDYLRDAIKSNIEAIKVSIKKDLGKKEFVDKNVESADEDDSDAEDTM
ncbi:16053_t:CDS:2, partial [Gigaspora margarita]